jgi:hypothetical protein
MTLGSVGVVRAEGNETMQRERVERDPLARRLDVAPVNDEPLTDEDREALREGREDIAAGRVVSMDDLRRELG